jgi:GDP-L-fucose synthase
MSNAKRLFLAGHNGLVGSALARRLESSTEYSLIVRSRKELDLRDSAAVEAFFSSSRPELVVLAAAKVGGIQANNTQPADFLRDNLQIQTNVIDSAYRNGASKLLFLGSSCIYPKFADQPIKERALLTGALEPTNEWYAIAKIAGLKMCQAYRRQYGFNAICAMPTNLYGPGDNFDLASSHVLPALIRKFHEARLASAETVVVWGTGTPRREFLHVDDLADALVYVLERYDEEEPINVGCGVDVSIKELAQTVAEVVGFRGQIIYDTSKPDGTPRKLLDVSKLTGLGWAAARQLKVGIEDTYDWFERNHARARL